MPMRALLFCLALALAGCASAPPPGPGAQARLAESFSRAASLVQSGNLAAAAREYEDARRTARSIEDADAIAAAAITLSIVYQRLGRDAAARGALADVLDAPRRPMSA